MIDRGCVVLLVMAAALTLPMAGANALDGGKYADLSGQWNRMSGGLGGGQWDTTKPSGLGQEAPLTPEYQAIYETTLANRAIGGLDSNLSARCLPSGMPRAMAALEPIEIIQRPDVIYMAIGYMNELRRIYTDGRDWPQKLASSFIGYSIGKWTDQDRLGRFRTLAIETRGMAGPRVFEATGIPMHRDNQTVVTERIYLDPSDRDLLHDEITTFDHALTRPWAVIKSYRRDRKPVWTEFVCAEDNHQVVLGDENYFRSADGYLMPARKDQAPPDLRYFDQPRR